MRELDADNVLDYLRSCGRLPENASAEARRLGGGVSNVVLEVRSDSGEAFVVKQSRRKLQTKIDWFSRLDRIWRERDFMQIAASVLPAGAVPRILFEDRENYLIAMEAVDPHHRVWKRELLDGRVDPGIAELLGDCLAAVHRETAGVDEIRRRLEDREIFRQLRVDPYYRHVGEVDADLRPLLEKLVDEMDATAICAVHADFSPKNILITGRTVTVVDFETGHYGDPAFDLGFFLSHLCLKTVLHAGRRAEYLNLARTFWSRYAAGLGETAESGPFRQAELERRTIGHLAGCMLARIDGTSRIDYLPDEYQQNLVRAFCRQLFHDPPLCLDEAFERLDTVLSED